MFELLKKHWRIALPSFIIMLFVGVGQTFLVAQFNPYIMNELGLSRTQISSTYSLATFLASLNLSYIGSLFDRKNLTFLGLGIVGLISVGLGILSLSQGVVSLFFGFYFLRGFGQVPLGLMVQTTVGKWFGKNRGKMASLTVLGRSLSEGVFPPLVVFMITAYGWRNAFFGLIILLCIVVIPTILIFVPSFPKTPLYEEESSVTDEHHFDNWSWGEVIKRKWPFYVMINNALVPFVLTGLFFQQGDFAKFKGWSMMDMANAFIAFSIFHIIAIFLGGPLVDRFSAKKLQPLILIPMLVAIAFLYYIDAVWGAYAYLGISGLAIGMNGIIRNAFFAEVYGISKLGRIKGMDSKVTVIGTALAPIVYSVILDWGVGVTILLQILFTLTLIGQFNYMIIYKRFN